MTICRTPVCYLRQNSKASAHRGIWSDQWVPSAVAGDRLCGDGECPLLKWCWNSHFLGFSSPAGFVWWSILVHCTTFSSTRKNRKSKTNQLFVVSWVFSCSFPEYDSLLADDTFCCRPCCTVLNYGIALSSEERLGVANYEPWFLGTRTFSSTTNFRCSWWVTTDQWPLA